MMRLVFPTLLLALLALVAGVAADAAVSANPVPDPGLPIISDNPIVGGEPTISGNPIVGP
jgi:hypothetical protein